MYVSGSAEDGTIDIAGLTSLLTDFYNMILARIDAAGQGRWLIQVHDETFSRPRVDATDDGYLFFSGPIMDSASLGGFVVPPPQWVYGMFLARLDTSGAVYWMNGVPLQPGITGDFSVANGMQIAHDANGGVYLFGKTRGFVDWGNGISTGVSGATSVSYSSLLYFNISGIPQWSLDAVCDHSIPYAILSIPGGGYSSQAQRGDAQFGSIQITQPSIYTFYTSLIKFSNPTTAINETNPDHAIAVFPNPSTAGMFQFSEELSKGRLTVTDLQGRCVYELLLTAPTRNIHLPLPTGYYLIDHPDTGRMPVMITR
jgi:hypothetical protein